MAIKVANNQSMTGITAMQSAISGGAWTLLSTQTASSSSTISFTSGLDSTYDVYCFTFYNIHPSVHETEFSFNMSVDGGSNYNVTKTTSRVSVYHKEDDSGTPAFTYHASSDLAQATGFQDLFQNIGIENYESASGYLYLYAPSSTVFVKHFISRGNIAEASDYTEENYTAGYGNTTSAVNAVQFKMDSGNIDAGVIKLYGIS